MKKDWACERCHKEYTLEEVHALAKTQGRRGVRCQQPVGTFEVPSEVAGSLKCTQLCSGLIWHTKESVS
jgi:hypothetical protein